jgi:hypothetical protein
MNDEMSVGATGLESEQAIRLVTDATPNFSRKSKIQSRHGHMKENSDLFLALLHAFG